MMTCIFPSGSQTSLRHVVVDVLVLSKDENQILLVRRAAHLNNGGKWGVAGGYMERNETCKQAALREVREETGYTVSEPKLLAVIDKPNRTNEDMQNVSFLYSAHALEQVGEPDAESSEICWFPITSLPAETEFAFDHFEHIMFYLEKEKTQHENL